MITIFYSTETALDNIVEREKKESRTRERGNPSESYNYRMLNESQKILNYSRLTKSNWKHNFI